MPESNSKNSAIQHRSSVLREHPLTSIVTYITNFISVVSQLPFWIQFYCDQAHSALLMADKRIRIQQHTVSSEGVSFSSRSSRVTLREQRFLVSDFLFDS